MKLAVALAAAFGSARAGSATGPSTPPPSPSPGVGGPLRRALAVAAVVVLAACGGGSDPIQVTHGSIRGTVAVNSGAAVANAVVALTGSTQAARTTTSGADGVYTFANVPPGTYTLAVTPPTGFIVGTVGTASVTVAAAAEANASAFILSRAPVGPGEWGLRANLLENNSEFALAEANGKLYVLGGYPPTPGPFRTARTVQVYDIASDRWAARTGAPAAQQPRDGGRRQRKDLHDRRPDHG